MSIPAARAELDKEIAQLDKKRERLVVLRDALLKEEPKAADSADAPAPAKRTVPKKKSVAAKKAVVPKKQKTAKKRTLSPEGRKRIADAARARWAKKKPAASA